MRENFENPRSRKFVFDGKEYTLFARNVAIAKLIQAMYVNNKSEAIIKAKEKYNVQIDCPIALYYTFCLRNGIQFSLVTKKGSNRSKKGKVRKDTIAKVAKGFYDSEEWIKLRKQVVKLYGCQCMKCGIKNVEVHADHIKPRSIYPNLELDIHNLQILCKSCNKDKSNKNEIDYRKEAHLIKLKDYLKVTGVYNP